ncbi:MAG: hypothetical protein Q8M20_14385 [Rhodocyclaceae bacterium]|nr:hypothetical protein [Rhodocyclaceae bacterium]MDZ4216189.1 hypothetical protein [Rhodocyclaceae bacterium]
METIAPANTSPEDDPRSEANIARRQALGIAERDALGRLLPGSVLPGAGRKADGVTVVMLARSHTNIAVALLARAVEDEKQAMAARVTAAQALLDRGWGKAPIQVDVQVRAKFDDFLRDVGLAAQWERDYPEDGSVK